MYGVGNQILSSTLKSNWFHLKTETLNKETWTAWFIVAGLFNMAAQVYYLGPQGMRGTAGRDQA